ncbi:MAG: class II aldolase/adducin family protein [Promethearchaeota archaeon]
MGEEEYVGIKFQVECLGSLDISRPSIHSLATELLMEIKRIPRNAILENAGNVSIRSNEGFLITGSGTDLRDLWYQHLVHIIVKSWEEQPTRITYYGDRLPSSETNLHWQIYMKRTDVNGVVHLHPPNLTYLQKNPNLPKTPRTAPYGSLELAQMAGKVLENHDTVVLIDHGLVCASSTISKATNQACVWIFNESAKIKENSSV